MSQDHLPQLDVPVLKFRPGQALTQQQRLHLLRKLVTSEPVAGPPVAACLMLLHGLPLTRILRLTTSDLIRDQDGQLCLRHGDPPVPVPEPFAAMLTALAAGLPRGGWLFPGRRPGQPACYATMRRHLRNLGLPLRAARAAALRDLVGQVPDPVAAAALGLHHTTTQRQRAAAGLTWSRYAARP